MGAGGSSGCAADVCARAKQRLAAPRERQPFEWVGPRRCRRSGDRRESTRIDNARCSVRAKGRRSLLRKVASTASSAVSGGCLPNVGTAQRRREALVRSAERNAEPWRNELMTRTGSAGFARVVAPPNGRANPRRPARFATPRSGRGCFADRALTSRRRDDGGICASALPDGVSQTSSEPAGRSDATGATFPHRARPPLPPASGRP